MTKVLITGVTGQDGYYLAQQAHERGYEVHGMVRGQCNPKADLLKAELPFLNLVQGDLLDRTSLHQVVEQVRPDYVFNLGAITYIPFSWEQPELTYNVNFLGVQRLLEACETVGIKCFVQASTSEMFGPGHKQEVLLNEMSLMLPRSPYAIAKLAAHHLCAAYKSADKLRAVSAIMFNHESPRRPENFVTRKITLAAAAIRAGKQHNLALGNTWAMRDWGYAPEYMTALLEIAEHSQPSNSYVIATGESASVDDFARHVFELAELLYDRIHRESEGLARKNDIQWLQGDARKASIELRWTATTKWRELARFMLEHDLQAQGLSL